MSSGSSGRYQSKLFNFVHQQSRRLTEKLQYTVRQLQVTTKWGLEALLYPVYVLFGSAESAVKTFHTKEPQPQLRLPVNDGDRSSETTPTADTPIQNVLEAIQKLPSEETSATSTNTAPIVQLLKSWWQQLSAHSRTHNSPQIQALTISDNSPSHLSTSQLKDVLQRNIKTVQGIATNLENRHLVLVTANNELLDILTPQQQTKLLDRIISEVTHYWHYQKLAIAEAQTDLLPEIHRLLAKLTGKNTSNIPTIPPGVSTESFNTHNIFKLLDTVVAKLEEKTLVSVQQRSQKIIQISRTKLNVFVYGKDKLTATDSSESLENYPLNFQALIEAAINYFFGVGKSKQLRSEDTSSYIKEKTSTYKSRQLQPQDIDITANSWLNWGDLFGDAQSLTDKKIQPSSLATLANSSASLVQQKKQSPNLTPSQKVSQEVDAVKPTAISVNHRESKPGTQSHVSVDKTEANANWIEIKATSVEYEKHLLERILAWCDRAILWLEKILVKIVYLLRSLWQGK